MIPPSAFSPLTARSTVGVVDSPRSITSNPNPLKVLTTSALIISPLILASRPITIFFPFFCRIRPPKAAVNLTTSSGERVSPGFPPIVPLIPEMLLINATDACFNLRYSSRQAQVHKNKVSYKTAERDLLLILPKAPVPWPQYRRLIPRQAVPSPAIGSGNGSIPPFTTSSILNGTKKKQPILFTVS